MSVLRGKGKPFFWNPVHRCWHEVLCCGDLSIEGWVAALHSTGFCIARLKTGERL